MKTNPTATYSQAFIAATMHYEHAMDECEDLIVPMENAAKAFTGLWRSATMTDLSDEANVKRVEDALASAQGATPATALKWLLDDGTREAMIWMSENSKRVSWVFTNSSVASPKAVLKVWTKHFKQIVHAGMEAGYSIKEIAESLPDTLHREVRAEIDAVTLENQIADVARMLRQIPEDRWDCVVKSAKDLEVCTPEAEPTEPSVFLI